MNKSHRYADTKDTIDKLPEFVIAVMAINEHSQREVAEMYGVNQSNISAFCCGRAASLKMVLNMLDYCEEFDPTGRAYKIVQVMNQ